MSEAKASLSEFDRHNLFAACSREAERIGGDESTAEYFFVRAQSSRIWLSKDGAVTVADMDIEDWCGAIAWSAPGVGHTRTPLRAAPENATANEPTSTTTEQRLSDKQPRSGAKSRSRSQHQTAD